MAYVRAIQGQIVAAAPWRAGIGILVAILAGCAAPQPSPDAASPPVPTENGLALLTPYPPVAVKDSLARRLRIELKPLSRTEQDQVAVGQADAIRTALSSRGVGNPGPNGTGEIEWTEPGFVYLATYTSFSLPSYGGPGPSPAPFPAYLVQVLAPAIPGFPGENTALVIVDARTGELGTTFGSCVGVLCGPP
jgi:hypothetical protein